MIGWRLCQSCATLQPMIDVASRVGRLRSRWLAPLVPVVVLGLSGCKGNNISLITGPDSTPVATATAEATLVPNVVKTGYDSFAGNCLDAANEDLALIDYAQTQNYLFDMQLQVSPTTGCEANISSAAYHTFLTQVGQATLNMNDLNSQWAYGYAPTREAFVDSVYAKLQAHYPSVSKVSITVQYAGQLRATLTYNGHGQPIWQDYG
jgi:hypothetical protein